MSLKFDLPDLDLLNKTLNSPSINIPEIDYENLSPNRTANNTDRMVETLEEMQETAKKESVDQKKRSRIDRWISIAALIASVVAAAAALYPIFH